MPHLPNINEPNLVPTRSYTTETMFSFSLQYCKSLHTALLWSRLCRPLARENRAVPIHSPAGPPVAGQAYSTSIFSQVRRPSTTALSSSGVLSKSRFPSFLKRQAEGFAPCSYHERLIPSLGLRPGVDAPPIALRSWLRLSKNLTGLTTNIFYQYSVILLPGTPLL